MTRIPTPRDRQGPDDGATRVGTVGAPDDDLPARLRDRGGFG
jgi:hypothetical protein